MEREDRGLARNINGMRRLSRNRGLGDGRDLVGRAGLGPCGQIGGRSEFWRCRVELVKYRMSGDGWIGLVGY